MKVDRRPGRPAPDGRRRGRRPWRLAALPAVAALLGAAGCGSGSGGGEQSLADRQAEVAERGAQVMPFDLDATTHSFEPRSDGLVETVVADDPGADDQVELVRGHLAHEAERFTTGDYGDPASIHGDDMPGLGELSAGADRIDVTYADVPAGARITFTTDDPQLVDALHLWGDAQVSDHGSHAEHAD